eukprot:9241080-Pyramimonas_sp.AAC.3
MRKQRPLQVTASPSREIRRRVKRNGLDHLSCSVWEPRIARMSQEERAGLSQIRSPQNANL